jgi:hypothetical protein
MLFFFTLVSTFSFRFGYGEIPFKLSKSFLCLPLAVYGKIVLMLDVHHLLMLSVEMSVH